jgi:hypothetical protein
MPDKNNNISPCFTKLTESHPLNKIQNIDLHFIRGYSHSIASLINIRKPNPQGFNVISHRCNLW